TTECSRPRPQVPRGNWLGIAAVTYRDSSRPGVSALDTACGWAFRACEASCRLSRGTPSTFSAVLVLPGSTGARDGGARCGSSPRRGPDSGAGARWSAAAIAQRWRPIAAAGRRVTDDDASLDTDGRTRGLSQPRWPAPEPGVQQRGGGLGQR